MTLPSLTLGQASFKTSFISHHYIVIINRLTLMPISHPRQLRGTHLRILIPW